MCFRINLSENVVVLNKIDYVATFIIFYDDVKFIEFQNLNTYIIIHLIKFHETLRKKRLRAVKKRKNELLLKKMKLMLTNNDI